MTQFEREKADFEDFKKFELPSRNFSRQFCGIYRARLATLKPNILKRVKSKDNKLKILQIVDLTNEEYMNAPCVIIGTLYKHQELKPSILKELSEELQAVPQPPRLNYCSPKDTLFLEDNVSRVKLVGNITLETLVSGIACAVLGHGLNDGSFWVEDFCFPGPHLLPLSEFPSSCAKDHGKLLLFLSGLDFVNQNNDLSLELFNDWITGLIGNEKTQGETARVVNVIIAGNSIRGSPETFTRKGYFENKKKDDIFALEVHRAVHKFDTFVSEIAQSCNVTLLPGEFDPSCHSLPQHPLHHNMLPKAYRQGSVCGVTNPWIGKIGSRTLGGSSGQPILDIMKVTNTSESPLGWLEKTLEWQHFAPTAPDTLPEYPFDLSDPFVMNEYPNIYFAGNMEKYETKLLQGFHKIGDSEGQTIRLICIPKFSTTHTAVLVDLESLDAKLISFQPS